jgi:hypothetical protein
VTAAEQRRDTAASVLAALGGALAGTLWADLFARWSRGPALWLFEQAERHFELAGAAVVMASDLLFALLTGVLAAELLIRPLRPHRYRIEAAAVAAFLGALFAKAGLTAGGLAFVLRLPPLWLFLMTFAIRVGYGIKAQRQRRAAGV